MSARRRVNGVWVLIAIAVSLIVAAIAAGAAWVLRLVFN